MLYDFLETCLRHKSEVYFFTRDKVLKFTQTTILVAEHNFFVD